MKVNGQPSTFAQVYCKLRDLKIEEMPESISDKYVTGEGEVRLDADWPLKATMRTVMELTRQNIDPRHPNLLLLCSRLFARC